MGKHYGKQVTFTIECVISSQLYKELNSAKAEISMNAYKKFLSLVIDDLNYIKNDSSDYDTTMKNTETILDFDATIKTEEQLFRL